MQRTKCKCKRKSNGKKAVMMLCTSMLSSHFPYTSANQELKDNIKRLAHQIIPQRHTLLDKTTSQENIRC